MMRFYKVASVGEGREGFSILLDGRSVKTPAKTTLIVPSRPLAEAMVEEWNAQVEQVNADAMPLNRFANTAIDRVSAHRDMVVAEIAGFAQTDHLCYRATYPSELIESQNAGWDPILTWIDSTHGVKLTVAQGVMAIHQPQMALDKMAALIAGHDDFELAALHTATHITGSVVLALALFGGVLDDERAWALSRLDEDYQAKHWGEDADAMKVAERRKEALRSAAHFLQCYRAGI